MCIAIVESDVRIGYFDLGADLLTGLIQLPCTLTVNPRVGLRNLVASWLVGWPERLSFSRLRVGGSALTGSCAAMEPRQN